MDVATGTVTEWQGEPVIAGVDGSTPSITAGILEDLAVQLELPQVADQWAQIVGRDLLDGHILWSVDAEAPSTNYGYMFGSCEGLVFAGAGAFRVEDGALAWRWPGERRAVNGMTMKEQGRVIAEFESVADTTVRTVASFNCADGSGAVEFANTWDFWNHALFVPGDEPLVIARADQDGETNNRLVAHSAASGELRFDVPLVDFMSGSFSFGGFTSEGVLYVQDSVLGAFDLSTKTWLWTTDWVERPQNCENHGHHPIYNRGVVFTNSTPIIALDSESGNILGFTVTSDGSPAGDYPMLHGDELIVSGGGNLLSYDVSSLR